MFMHTCVCVFVRYHACCRTIFNTGLTNFLNRGLYLMKGSVWSSVSQLIFFHKNMESLIQLCLFIILIFMAGQT